MKKISVVIAAFNEAERISKVLRVVEKHPLIHEVIVVNDGSADNTSEIVKKFNVRLIENEHNMGKTLSVKKGIEQADGDLIMLLDADLIGLDQDAISKLARPVLEGQVDCAMSLRGNSWFWMRFAKMDWISGERIASKEFFKNPLIWSRPDIGYGLEALMNRVLLENNLKFCSVDLPQLKIVLKWDKVGFIKGLAGEIRMIKQISRVVPFRKFMGQFFKMSRLNRKYSQAKPLAK